MSSFVGAALVDSKKEICATIQYLALKTSLMWNLPRNRGPMDGTSVGKSQLLSTRHGLLRISNMHL
jgi:hypothetical protein